jgi:hypothetical protein
MQTFRLNSPTIFVWLVLLPLGCAAVDDGGGAAGQGDRAETQQGGPTKEQIEAMMAEAYERASKPPQYIQHIVLQTTAHNSRSIRTSQDSMT